MRVSWVVEGGCVAVSREVVRSDIFSRRVLMRFSCSVRLRERLGSGDWALAGVEVERRRVIAATRQR